MSKKTVRSGFYRHYKNKPYRVHGVARLTERTGDLTPGASIRVLGVARHSETLEEIAVYEVRLHGQPAQLLASPAKDFPAAHLEAASANENGSSDQNPVSYSASTTVSNGPDLVFYEALYPNADGQLWVRPTDMFLEEVSYNGIMVPRFMPE